VYRRLLVLISFCGLALGLVFVGAGLLEGSIASLSAPPPVTPDPAGAALAAAPAGAESPTATAPAVTPDPVAGLRPAVAADAFARMNIERRAAGLHELVLDEALVREAEVWAEDMTRNGYRHSSTDRLRAVLTISDSGAVGENLHAPEAQCGAALICSAPDAQPTSGVLHTDWMRSGSHRSTLLATAWDRAGIAVFCDAGGRMWAVALFGSPPGLNVDTTATVPYREPFVAGNDGVLCSGEVRPHNPLWNHHTPS